MREYLASTIGRPLPPYIDPTTGADSYDADVDATVDLLFGVVAFRYGHSSATTIFPRLDNAKREIPEGHLAVRDTLFVPKYWSVADAAGGPDRFEGGCVFRGLANMLASNLDVGLTSDLRNHMFFGPYGGSDLYATNIARARDVGLPGACVLAHSRSRRRLQHDSRGARSGAQGCVDQRNGQRARATGARGCVRARSERVRRIRLRPSRGCVRSACVRE